ncbi:MAG: rod shape-determining protein MreC [Patescibacteria group bacterium]|jgi:rod shape-determining protein MreC
MRQKIFNLRINVLFLILVAIVLLVFLHSVGFLRPVENAVFYVLRPIEKITYNAGLRFFASENIKSAVELGRNNQDLQNQLSNALIENARLHSLMTKSEVLQQEVEYLKSNNYEFQAAQIIGKSPHPGTQLYILDRGTNDGIAVGMPVVYKDGILVGKIVEVGDNDSNMILITDSNSSIGAYVQNATNSPGVVVGKLGLSLEMQLIPQSEEILTDQIVVSSGIEENIPEGLVIGQVSSISNQTEELFQTASIQPPVTLDRLQIVSIIIR